MSFKTQNTRSRFSFYCLEEAEEYFDEAICTYYPPVENARAAPLSTRPKQKGRLRVCSNSLFFEPDERRQPIVKFPLKSVVEQEVAGSPQANTQTPNLFFFHCVDTVQMLQHGHVRPHTFVSTPGQHVFSLSFTKVDTFLKPVNHLLRLQQLSRSARAQAIQQITKLREAEYKFDYSRLGDVREVVRYAHAAYSVIPLVRIRGRVLVTDRAVYFQAFNAINANPVQRLSFDDICRVDRRRYMLRDIALELQAARSRSLLYVAFDPGEEAEVQKMYQILTAAPLLQRMSTSDLSVMVTRWRNGEVSNFDYLMYLNVMAGRSMNDLSQYPVFPWVLVDYMSDTLDLTDPSVYRDLSKPIGALNPKRLGYFKDRMAQMEAAEAGRCRADSAGSPTTQKPETKRTSSSSFLSFLKNGRTDRPAHGSGPDRPAPPAPSAAAPQPTQPFLFGTHYSTPGYVVFFRVRDRPEYMLLLHRGRFDAPDRMFESVADCWHSVTHNHADVKELIPEFFDGDGAFLVNTQKCDLGLGTRQDGRAVRESVRLPPWASDSPGEFIRLHRAALESPHVSRALHLWVDLIFGYKQRGPHAAASDNLFHPITYEHGADLDHIDDELQRSALELQIREFGQTPRQLFREPHPPRAAPGGPPGSPTPASGAEGRGGAARSPPLRLVTEKVRDQRPTTAAGAEPESSGRAAAPDVAADGAPEGGEAAFRAHARVHKGAVLSCCAAPLQRMGWLHDGPPNGARDPVIACTVSKDGTAKIHDLGRDQKLRSFGGIGTRSPLSSLCLTRRTRAPVMLMGSWDDHIYMFAPESGRLLDKVLGHAAAVSCLALGPDDRLLVSGSRDATVRVWQVRDGGMCPEPVAEYDHEDEVADVAVDAHGQYALSASADGTVALYDLRVGQGQIRGWAPHGDGVTGCRWLTGESFVTCGRDNTLKVFSMSADRPLATVPTGAVSALAVSVAGARVRVLASDAAGAVDVYDMQRGERVACLRGHESLGRLQSIAVAEDTGHVIAGDEGGQVSLWQL